MRLQAEASKTRSRSTEAAFEKRFAKALTRLGLLSYHTSEKFISGIPDRYVVGGNWIEFKAIPYTGKRQITPVRFFSASQKLWMNRLGEAGDRVWVCILFQPENGNPLAILCPWVALNDFGPMSPKQISEFGTPVYKDIDLYNFVSQRFGLNQDRFSDCTDWLVI